MADVPLLSRQQVAPGVQPGVRVPARGSDGVGAEVLGQVTAQIALQARERADRAAELAAYTEAQQATTRSLYGEVEDGKIVKPGLLALRGLNLMQSHEQYETGLRESYDKIIAAQNPRVQGRLRQRLDALYADAQGRVAPHLAREVEEFQERTYNAAIVSEIQSGAFAGSAVRVSPETGEIDTSRTETAKRNLLAHVEGLALDHPYLLEDQTQEEWIAQEYERVTSLLHDQTVKLALSNGDADGAKRYLAEYEAEILPWQREELSRDVGAAFASLEAERVAGAAVAKFPLIIGPNGAAEAERRGLDYTTNAQGKALALDEAEAQGGPEARKLAKERWEELEKLQEQHYEETLEQIEGEVLEFGYEEAKRRNPGLFGDYFRSGDLTSLEKLDETERDLAAGRLKRKHERRADALEYSLEVMKQNRPDEYYNFTQSERLDILSVLGTKRFKEWFSEWQADVEGKTGGAPTLGGAIEAWGEELELTELQRHQLHRRVSALARAARTEGKPLSHEEQVDLVERFTWTSGYLKNIALTLPGDRRLYELTAPEAREVFPEVLRRAAENELEAAGVDDPSPDDVTDYLLTEFALEGTAVPGVGLPSPPPLPKSDEEIADEALGSLTGEQLAEHLAGAARAAAERAAQTSEELRREAAFLRARDPDDLMRVVRRAVGPGLTGDTRPAKLARRIQDGTASEEEVRALVAASRELDFEDFERREEDRRLLLPTLADTLVEKNPEIREVLERIRKANPARRGYRGHYLELFKRPVEDLTPAQRRRAEELIVWYTTASSP